MAAAVEVPGLNQFPVDYLPDEDDRFPVLVADESHRWQANTLTRREVCMLRMVEELTNKPEWWRKVRDPDIPAKWKREALGMDWGSVIQFGDFTPAMADACISELRKKAELYEKTGLIPVMDYSACAIKSDNLLDRDLDLLNELKAAVSRLEDLPDDERDWHPRSNQKVLDLVHPSLYPLVYGKTRVLMDRRISLSDALDSCGSGIRIPRIEGQSPSRNVSYQFQWLPCDVNIEGGRVKIDSYINNLHPVDHAALYTVIERFIEKSLPAWDLIYRWPGEFDLQRIACTSVVPECLAKECEAVGCALINRPVEQDEPEREEDEDDGDDYEGSERYKRDVKWFDERHPLPIPEPSAGADYFKIQPSHVKSGGFFKDASRIQVIVKLANIHLTPDNPSYDGGTWHVEGQLNEHICATALFYYDNDNISDCHLEFRTLADREDLMMELDHEQGDNHNIKRALAIDPWSDKMQDIGSVLTRPGRALFFPNVYQHHVSPFRLADPSRPGHRKILALFLVDPAIPIISTSNVPPQQRQWWSRQVDLENTRIGRLPPEVSELIFENDCLPMSEDEAKRLREELMDERSALQVEHESGMRQEDWSFCEH